MMKTQDFLNEVYRDCDDGYLTLTILPERKTLWFKITEIEKAAIFAQKYGLKTNVFFGVGLRKEMLKNGFRGSEKDIFCMTALYADIDIKGEAHFKISLPNSVNEIISFLNNLKFNPSIIVNSGNGVHCYWLLNKLFIIESEQERKYISELFKSFGKYINSEAKKYGWKLDNVYDLARMLRIPGTINHKLNGNTGNTKCEIMKSNNKRYELSDIEDLIKTKDLCVSVSKIPQNINKVLEKCEFIKYCKEKSKTLPEPLWHAMITNLAPLKNSSNAIHELSKSYPKYSFEETEHKLQRARLENKPHTCKYIKENLNFNCGKNCPVKAPIVHGLPDYDERIKNLISSEKINVDNILSKDTLKLCAWAKTNLPSEYAKLKAKLKGKINLRDFEKAVRFENRKIIDENNCKKAVPIELEGINLNGAKIPQGWKVSMNFGTQKVSNSKDSSTVTAICKSPVVITKRLENLDDGTEKIELSFFRDNKWKNLIAPRSSAFNRNSIIKYADTGLPISSSSAAELVAYLIDYENENINIIPLVKSISRAGWINDNKLEFFPCKYNGNIIFESETSELDAISQGTIPHGDFELWKKYAEITIKNPFARFIIAASFASPILKLIDSRVFFVHIWHDSQSGKTAIIKFAVSVWGNPSKLMGSFNATSVGLERMAGTLKHLPFGIDELQVLNENKTSIEKIIYSLGNGFGRLRGNKTGGMQSILSWQNIMLTSGEQPINNESSNDGAITRVLELYGKPVEDTKLAHELHNISKTNYALAGREFMEFITKNINAKTAKEEYTKIINEIDFKCNSGISKAHIDSLAAVCLGDYYAGIAIFKKPQKEAWTEAVILGVKILKNFKELQKPDTIKRAWNFVTGWIASNKNRFSPDSTPCYGKIEQEKIYIIPNILKQSLEENGFNYAKVTRGFKDRNFIETCIDSKGHVKMQVAKSINGIVQKCFCIKEVIGGKNSNLPNPLI